MSKPKVAFFDFACCEGCQLEVLGMGQPLIDALEMVDVVAWREAISDKSDEFDVAIIEGSITRDSDIPRLKKIREKAKVVIALGACATLCGVQGLGNKFGSEEMLPLVYGDKGKYFDADKIRPISAVIKVDCDIHGCPINPAEFLDVLKSILLGKPYKVANEPVCLECKFNQYECLFDKGKVCLGPITRCGCNAICTSKGERCFGCRGLVDKANLKQAEKIFEKYGYSLDEIIGMFSIYSHKYQPQDNIDKSNR